LTTCTKSADSNLDCSNAFTVANDETTPITIVAAGSGNGYESVFNADDKFVKKVSSSACCIMSCELLKPMTTLGVTSWDATDLEQIMPAFDPTSQLTEPTESGYRDSKCGTTTTAAYMEMMAETTNNICIKMGLTTPWAIQV